MKISIEVFDKESKPFDLYAILVDQEALLGAPPSKEKAGWQPLVDKVVQGQSNKVLNRDAELFHFDSRALFVSQLPKKKGLDRPECLRLAAGSVLDSAKSRSWKRFAIALNRAGAPEIRAAAEGLLYADYEFRRYKSEPAKGPADLEAVLLVKAADLKAAETALAEVQVMFAHLRNLRDWVNLPGSDLDPAAFAEIAQGLARKHGLEAVIRDEKKLRKEGFLGLWTVGKGSDRPPRMVTLSHKARRASKRHLCVVGKGVTFDTGGISLKPGAGMAEMKCDMAGAATALAGVCAAAELELPVDFSAVLCLAENRPGNASVLPGDIFKAKSGKTVMVDNTDAEGRLALSDGLYEAGELKASHIVDIATLTGSVVRALGGAMAGLFANDRDFGAAIRKLGQDSGEKFWELPLEEEYREWLDDPVADLRNVTNKNEAGAITAALFLKEFVPSGAKWSHWDVAGTAFTTASWKYFKPGATGFGLKTLLALAKSLG